VIKGWSILLAATLFVAASEAETVPEELADNLQARL
jgi:hypothetical protein